MSKVKLTRALDGDYPKLHRDVLRPADYLVETNYGISVISGKLASYFTLPCIVSGMVVTQGAGDTLNISAGAVIVKTTELTTIKTNDQDGSQLPTNIPIAPYFTLVDFLGVTNMVLPGGLSAGDNKVLVIFKSTDFLERHKRADITNLYAVMTQDDLEILVVPVATVVTDSIEIGRFTGNVGITNFRNINYYERAPLGIHPIGARKYITTLTNTEILDLGDDDAIFKCVDKTHGYEFTYKYQASLTDKLYREQSEPITNTKDTAVSINMYRDTSVKIQNLSGITISIYVDKQKLN